MSSSRNHRAQPRRWGDDGAVLVEAAFALPIFLFAVLGFIDFSLWEFQEGQASSAARDGARVGILLPLDAANQATTKAEIEAAARARIPNAGSLDSFSVSVYCEGGTQGVDFSGCGSATPGVTRLLVTTSWRYETVSPAGAVFGTPTISSTAGMLYVGPRTPSGPAPDPGLCEVQTGLVTVPALSGSSLADPMTLAFTTNGAVDCSGWTVTLLDDEGVSMGSGTVDAAAGLATIAPSDVSGLAPGSYVIRLATTSREWMVDVTLSGAGDCAVVFDAPVVPKLAGSTLAGNLTASFTTNGAPNCSDWTVELLDDDGTSRGSGTVDGAAGSIVFTPGQVSGLTPGTYTIRLSTPIANWSVSIGLTAECAVTVSASPSATTIANGGDLRNAISATVATNGACSGSFTVQLVRMTADELFTVFQTRTLTNPSTSTSFSVRKQDLEVGNPKKWEPGTYRVFVSGGGLPPAGAFSGDVTVS